MYSSVLSGVLYGLKAEIVRVEVDVGNGIPSFEMSGFLSYEVKEARVRVRVAIRMSFLHSALLEIYLLQISEKVSQVVIFQ